MHLSGVDDWILFSILENLRALFRGQKYTWSNRMPPNLVPCYTRQAVVSHIPVYNLIKCHTNLVRFPSPTGKRVQWLFRWLQKFSRQEVCTTGWHLFVPEQTCPFLDDLQSRSPYLQWFQYNFHPSWRQIHPQHFRRSPINILNSWYYSVQGLEIPYHMSLAIVCFSQPNLISIS